MDSTDENLVYIGLTTYLKAAHDNDFLGMFICMGVVYCIEQKHAEFLRQRKENKNEIP